MAELEATETRQAIPAWKVKLVGFAVGATALVSAVSADAYDLNGTIGPILDSVGALVPSIIALVIALVPAVIAISVIGFIVGFFDKILAMMKL